MGKANGGKHNMVRPHNNEVKTWRMLNRDGTANVWRPDRQRINAHDLYHSLMSLSRAQFILLIPLAYLLVNILFASVYFALGPDALEGTAGATGSQRFLDCFFFSVQTLATIGYGKITPTSVSANIFVTLEALVGLLGIAMATGLIFARFSRATARVVFSNTAVINKQDGLPSLIFRIANERYNSIVAAQVSVVLIINEVTSEGETYRGLYDLKLERSNTPIFGLSWTVIHPIDSTSPLYGYDDRRLREGEAELLVVVSGIDETFNQNIFARFSYTPDEILWDVRFKDILSRCDGLLTMDMDHFHEVQPLQ